MVAGLGIGEVDTVEQDEHLVESTSSHGEVALSVAATAHTEIHPGEQSHEVGDGMNRGLSDVVCGKNRRRLSLEDEAVGAEGDSNLRQCACLAVVSLCHKGTLGEDDGKCHHGGAFGQAAVGDAGRQVSDCHLTVQRTVGCPLGPAKAAEAEHACVLLC